MYDKLDIFVTILRYKKDLRISHNVEAASFFPPLNFCLPGGGSEKLTKSLIVFLFSSLGCQLKFRYRLIDALCATGKKNEKPAP